MAAEYKEHSMLLDGAWPMGGHPDLFLSFPGHIFRVCEIKTMNGKDFESLKAPLADHEAQTRVYMWGLNIDPKMPVVIDPELGFIMYVSKQSFKKIFPMKIFPIRQSKSTINMVKDIASIYKIGMDNYPNRLPVPHRECSQGNFANYRAKTCVCREKCLEFL